LNLKDIKTNLSFEDGNIKVKPFDFEVEDIKITAGGNHSFDQSMNYNLTLDVPAKYFGNEVSGLLSQLSPKEANSATVQLPVGISGNFTNPKVNLDAQQGIKQLTQNLISKQKDKAKEQLVGQGQKVISGLLGGSKKQTDSTQKNTAKDILGGFLGKKKKKDSTKAGN